MNRSYGKIADLTRVKLKSPSMDWYIDLDWPRRWRIVSILSRRRRIPCFFPNTTKRTTADRPTDRPTRKRNHRPICNYDVNAKRLSSPNTYNIINHFFPSVKSSSDDFSSSHEFDVVRVSTNNEMGSTHTRTGKKQQEINCIASKSSMRCTERASSGRASLDES